MQELWDFATSALGLKVGVSFFVGAALSGLGLFLKGPHNDTRRRYISTAAWYAFNIVEDIAKERTKGDGIDHALDKAAEGLKKANEWMVANGWKPLKKHEEPQALLAFSSFHGEQIVRERMAMASSAVVIPNQAELEAVAPGKN